VQRSDYQLSRHFNLSEFITSQAAERKGIHNRPGAGHIENLRALVNNVIEPARVFINMPVLVSSGYRSPELNDYIGGSPSSQHKRGEAADLITADMPLLFFTILHHLPFDQLIWEFGDDLQPGWIHVSYSTKYNRKEVLRATRKDGRTIYIPLNAKGEMS
jgi:zinc D-Ala-D-Ala carboxypeptidase